MMQRANINEIAPASEDWICKIQVVDKGHPQNNKEGTKKYQLMVLQDEEETQILAIMFGNDITHFEDAFVPFQTYLVSTAYVCESTRTYEESLHQFYWTVDHNTIVEPIKEVIPTEQPLAPPTQLKLTSFDSFDYQPIGSEFDILAIVINGTPPSYTPNGSRIQEFIIIDHQKKPTKLTLWEEFIDLYGEKLLAHPKKHEDFPVILAKKSGQTKINFRSDEIKSQLNSYITKSTTATRSLLFVPFEQHTIPIADIQQQPSTASNYFQEVGLKEDFIVQLCRQSTYLIPRCHFEVTIQDDSGSTTTIISDKIGEELLCLTAAEIYGMRCVKNASIYIYIYIYILLEYGWHHFLAYSTKYWWMFSKTTTFATHQKYFLSSADYPREATKMYCYIDNEKFKHPL